MSKRDKLQVPLLSVSPPLQHAARGAQNVPSAAGTQSLGSQARGRTSPLPGDRRMAARGRQQVRQPHVESDMMPPHQGAWCMQNPGCLPMHADLHGVREHAAFHSPRLLCLPLIAHGMNLTSGI